MLGSRGIGNGFICLVVNVCHRCETQAGLSWIACQEQEILKSWGRRLLQGQEETGREQASSLWSSYLFLARSENACQCPADPVMLAGWNQCWIALRFRGQKPMLCNSVHAEAAGSTKEIKMWWVKLKDEKIFELRKGMEKRIFWGVSDYKAALCFNYCKLNLWRSLLYTYYSFN